MHSGPWPCPICGQYLYSHQVHLCRPPLPPAPDFWGRWRDQQGYISITTTTTPKKKEKPVEALRPEDV